MHKLGRFIQELMDAEGMTRPELVRRSGLSRQHVHGLLVGDELKRMPSPETFEALRRAFPHVAPRSMVLAAAEAMGMPVVADPDPDYSRLSNDTLLGILRERLEGGQQDAGTAEAEKRSRHRGRRRLRADEIRPEPGLVLPHDLAAMEHRAD